jgi:Ca2+/Na+ antiporter
VREYESLSSINTVTCVEVCEYVMMIMMMMIMMVMVMMTMMVMGMMMIMVMIMMVMVMMVVVVVRGHQDVESKASSEVPGRLLPPVRLRPVGHPQRVLIVQHRQQRPCQQDPPHPQENDETAARILLHLWFALPTAPLPLVEGVRLLRRRTHGATESPTRGRVEVGAIVTQQIQRGHLVSV